MRSQPVEAAVLDQAQITCPAAATGASFALQWRKKPDNLFWHLYDCAAKITISGLNNN